MKDTRSSGAIVEELGAIAPLLLREGFLVRAVHGEQVSLAVAEVDPGAELPEHVHGNEQGGILLEGSLVLRVGDETRTIGPGAMWCIPPRIPHSLSAGPTGAVLIDVFSPPRTDWPAPDVSLRRRLRWPA